MRRSTDEEDIDVTRVGQSVDGRKELDMVIASQRGLHRLGEVLRVAELRITEDDDVHEGPPLDQRAATFQSLPAPARAHGPVGPKWAGPR
jgi:hypothetical protein